MSEFVSVKQYSTAYHVLMSNIELLRTVYKFYPWATRESRWLFESNPEMKEEFLPNITLVEALYRIDVSAQIVLKFSLISIVSTLENYFYNRVKEHLQSTLTVDFTEIAKEMQIEEDQESDEHNNLRDSFINKEVRDFGFKRWPHKMKYLKEKFDIEFPKETASSIRNIIDLRNNIVHQIAITEKEIIIVDQELLKNSISQIVYAASIVEEKLRESV